MEKERMIEIAEKALEKGWDFETMKHSDDLYDKEHFADEIWEFVKEGKRKGMDWFIENYY